MLGCEAWGNKTKEIILRLSNEWYIFFLEQIHKGIYFCLSVLLRYRVFSLTWPASMQMFWNKRNHLHKKRVHLPQDWFGTPTWPPFHCFGTPIWPTWRHVKTLYLMVYKPPLLPHPVATNLKLFSLENWSVFHNWYPFLGQKPLISIPYCSLHCFIKPLPFRLEHKHCTCSIAVP